MKKPTTLADNQPAPTGVALQRLVRHLHGVDKYMKSDLVFDTSSSAEYLGAILKVACLEARRIARHPDRNNNALETETLFQVAFEIDALLAMIEKEIIAKMPNGGS